MTYRWFASALALAAAMAAFAGPSSHAAPIADVLALHLDESRGSIVLDASGNGNHGRMHYDTTRTTGADAKFGGALSFDGRGDHVAVPDSPSFDAIGAGLTVEGWAKLTSDPNLGPEYNNYRMLFSKGGRGGVFDVVLEQSRNTQFSVRLDDGAGGTIQQRFYVGDPWGIGEWVHFAYTYDGATGTMAAYINGNEHTASRTAGTIATNNAPFYLSHPNNSEAQNGQGALPGILDEIAVYSTVLSGADVAERYANGPPQPDLTMSAPPPADILVYHLDERRGNVAYDATVFGRHGAVVNGATFGPSDGMFGGALHFDGVDDHVRAPLPSAESPTSGLTFEAWLYVDQDPDVDAGQPDAVNNWRWLFNKGGWATPFDAIFEQDRDITFSLKLDGDPTHYRHRFGQQVPLDEWAHLALTYDAETGMMRYFLNGVEESHPIGTTGDLATNDLDFFLSWPSVAVPSGHGAFPGWMDEVALYGRALSSDEILARFLDGPPEALVPEPSTWVLLALGAAAFLRLAGRRQRRTGPACCADRMA